MSHIQSNIKKFIKDGGWSFLQEDLGGETTDEEEERKKDSSFEMDEEQM